MKKNIMTAIKMIFAAAVMGAVFASVLSAKVALKSPADGETVALLNDRAKDFYSKSAAETDAIIRDKSEREKIVKTFGGGFKPVKFEWEGDGKKYLLEISENPDFENPQKFTARKISFAVIKNLKIAQKYYWRVSNIDDPSAKDVSQVRAFTTEDKAPRIMRIKGATNVRDLGGRIGLDGRRVRQNMAFRGTGLNANSKDGITHGKPFIKKEGVDFMVNVLKIKTDLDVRSKKEVADMSASPLGEKVRWVNKSSVCYGGLFTDTGKKNYADLFRFFADKNNYPIYFHCIGGADRTGSIAFMLNAVLGVADAELEKDWKTTVFADKNIDFVAEPRFHVLLKGFDSYGKEGDSYSVKVVNYLKSAGITQEEIDRFRNFMLE